jgi:hypothetical protein
MPAIEADCDDDDLNSVHYGQASHYCRHGTYVGSWAGPDYLCGPCEDGISDEEWSAICQARAERHEREAGEQLFFHAIGHMCRLEPEMDDSWAQFITALIEQHGA